MHGRSPDAIALIGDLVNLVEGVVFPFTDVVRAGYPERGVESGQRMSGHTESIGYLCDWFITELELSLDRILVSRLCRHHDLAKSRLGDKSRVPVQELRRPVGKIQARVRRFMSSGKSLRDRKEELARDLAALKPEFLDHPFIWEGVEESLTIYYLRPNNGKKEAEFVWSLGQVMDAHFALWYVDDNRMKRTAKNIRTFTDEMDARLLHWTAKLYWLVVKERYINTLVRVYPNKAMVLAQ